MFTYEDDHFGSFEASPQRDAEIRSMAKAITTYLLEIIERKYYEGANSDSEVERRIDESPLVYAGPLPLGVYDRLLEMGVEPRDFVFRVLLEEVDLDAGGAVTAGFFLPRKVDWDDRTYLHIQIDPSLLGDPEFASTLFHEIVHAIDWLRTPYARFERRGPPLPEIKEYSTPRETEAMYERARRLWYLNNPAEFNAWFQTGAEEYMSAGLNRVPVEFDYFLKQAVALSYSIREQEFYFRGKWHRKFRVRMYQLHELAKETFGAKVTSASDRKRLDSGYASMKRKAYRVVVGMRPIYKNLSEDE